MTRLDPPTARALAAAGVLLTRCGGVVAAFGRHLAAERAVRAAVAERMRRVSLWPLGACLLLCVGFAGWVVWYVR